MQLVSAGHVGQWRQRRNVAIKSLRRFSGVRLSNMAKMSYVSITALGDSKELNGYDIAYARRVGPTIFEDVHYCRFEGPYLHCVPWKRVKFSQGVQVEEISKAEYDEQERKSRLYFRVMAELKKPGTEYLTYEEEMLHWINEPVVVKNKKRIEELEQLCVDLLSIALMDYGY